MINFLLPVIAAVGTGAIIVIGVIPMIRTFRADMLAEIDGLGVDLTAEIRCFRADLIRAIQNPH